MPRSILSGAHILCKVTVNQKQTYKTVGFGYRTADHVNHAGYYVRMWSKSVPEVVHAKRAHFRGFWQDVCNYTIHAFHLIFRSFAIRAARV
jgi:hypothetical protein